MNEPSKATAAPVPNHEHDRPDQQKTPGSTPPPPGQQEHKDKQEPPQRREGVVSDPDAS